MARLLSLFASSIDTPPDDVRLCTDFCSFVARLQWKEMEEEISVDRLICKREAQRIKEDGCT